MFILVIIICLYLCDCQYAFSSNKYFYFSGSSNIYIPSFKGKTIVLSQLNQALDYTEQDTEQHSQLPMINGVANEVQDKSIVEAYDKSIVADKNIVSNTAVPKLEAMEKLYSVGRRSPKPSATREGLSDTPEYVEKKQYNQMEITENKQSNLEPKTAEIYEPITFQKMSSVIAVNAGYFFGFFGTDLSFYSIKSRSVQVEKDLTSHLFQKVQELLKKEKDNVALRKSVSKNLFNATVTSLAIRHRVIMINSYILLPVPNFQNVSFYCGGGVGLANTKLLYHNVLDLISNAKGEFQSAVVNSMAWNASVGLRFYLSKLTFADLKYSYLSLGKIPSTKQILIHRQNIVLNNSNLISQSVAGSMIGLSLGMRF